MASNKHHSATEIAAKLEKARELAAVGKNQTQIAQQLGVSVMTYHRWRRGLAANAPDRRPDLEGSVSKAGDVKNLKIENLRLRRLVTDLLLEKMRLEEAIGTALPRKRAK